MLFSSLRDQESSGDAFLFEVYESLSVLVARDVLELAMARVLHLVYEHVVRSMYEYSAGTNPTNA